MCLGEEEWRLGESEILTWADDYLDLAPENLAQTDKWQRYHQGDNAWSQVPSYDQDDLYAEELDENSEYWMEHDHVSIDSLWRYDIDRIQDDKRASYVSDKYPWLYDVSKYKGIGDQPFDMDLLRFNIEPRHGNHYVVHWRWNGYYDCTDVETFDTEVDNVYGILDTNSYVWNRIDHCQYVHFKKIVSPCMEAPFGMYPLTPTLLVLIILSTLEYHPELVGVPCMSLTILSLHAGFDLFFLFVCRIRCISL